MNETTRPRSPNLLLGAAAAAAIITIFAGVVAIVLFLLLQQWVALGLALIAVGATAGLVLNAVLRR
jgi:type IV secretory pathway TrbD component